MTEDDSFTRKIQNLHRDRVDDCVNRLLGDLMNSDIKQIKELVKKYRIKLIPGTEVHRILYPVGSKNKRHDRLLGEYKKTEQYKLIFGGNK